MFRIAHISDLHIPPMPRVSVKQLLSKRLLGQIAWFYKWKPEHQQVVLDALLTHLDRIKPDHICITGDITFTTLPAEVDAATEWISRLGDPGQISLIPGNHDAYVPGALDYALQQWSPWMQDDDGNSGFPYLHRRGPVDIVGLSSAVPSLPALSYGRLGPDQLKKTEVLLGRLKAGERPSLLLVHHPPQDGAASAKRALSDRKALQQVLYRSPVDLVLHGHLHYPIRAKLEGSSGPIPVLGAASASTIGKRKSVAHYHLIEIDTELEQPKMLVQHYHYDAAVKEFVAGEKQAI